MPRPPFQFTISTAVGAAAAAVNAACSATTSGSENLRVHSQFLSFFAREKCQKMGPRSHIRNGGPCYRCFLNARAIARMSETPSPAIPPPLSPMPNPTCSATTRAPCPSSPPPVEHMGQPRSPSPPLPLDREIKIEPDSPLSSDLECESPASPSSTPWRFPTPEPASNHEAEVLAPVNNPAQLHLVVANSQIHPPSFFEKRIIWIMAQIKR